MRRRPAGRDRRRPFGHDADDARDPDISFCAYLAWCAVQPVKPLATVTALRAGPLDSGAAHV